MVRQKTRSGWAKALVLAQPPVGGVRSSGKQRSGLEQRIAGRVDSIHARNRIEDDFAVFFVVGRNRRQSDRSEVGLGPILSPMRSGVVYRVSISRKLDHDLKLDRAF